MNVVLIVLSILLEAAFIFISIKAMKSEKLSIVKNILLFIGIIAANIGSGILTGSVFRYLLIVALYFIMIKSLYNKNANFYDIFCLFGILAFKITIETLTMLLFIKELEQYTLVNSIICNIIFLIFPIVLFKSIRKCYLLIDKLWKCRENFYIRYMLCITMISAIILYLNIILIYINRMWRI
ncbi:MAG: hypothetical protein FWF92_07670 [Oscillospiraceae bacterium]|nr:hypothetical protein [Oscillospiraceae bacterium]